MMIRYEMMHFYYSQTPAKIQYTINISLRFTTTITRQYLFYHHKIFGVVAFFLFEYKNIINGKEAREEIEGKSGNLNWGKVRPLNKWHIRDC